MKEYEQKIIGQGLIFALGEAVYIFLIALFFFNAQRIFGSGPDNKLLAPMAFLMLFVVSAAISGALVLGRPILLYLDNKKQEAVKLFLATLGWMVVFLIILFTALATR